MAEDISLVYEKRLVAFIDVMGFRELLDGDKAKLQRYYSYAYDFLEGKSGAYNETAPQDKFKRLFVSDSIILSVLLSENTVDAMISTARFFSSIALLQYNLAINAQIWTRGAISVGDLFIDEEKNLLVGQSFVQAYELEKLADYPRIIIDPKILGFFDIDHHDFVNEINMMSIPPTLIGAGGTGRFGMSNQFISDAIQIDWFRQVFDNENNNLKDFFEDLRNRQFTSQTLFQKTNKLLIYIGESIARALSDKLILEDPVKKGILNQMLNQMKTFLPDFKSIKPR